MSKKKTEKKTHTHETLVTFATVAKFALRRAPSPQICQERRSGTSNESLVNHGSTDPRIHGSCHLRIYNVSWLQGGDTRTGCILLSNQPASSCVWHARVSGFSVVCPLLVMAGPIDEHFLSRFRSLVAGRRSLLVQERLCRLVTCLIHRQRCYLAHPSCCLSPLLGIL